LSSFFSTIAHALDDGLASVVAGSTCAEARDVVDRLEQAAQQMLHALELGLLSLTHARRRKFSNVA